MLTWFSGALLVYLAARRSAIRDEPDAGVQPPTLPSTLPAVTLSGRAALVLGYVALALVVTWPLVGRLHDGIAQGTDTNGTVTYASAWALWWTGEALSSGLTGLWSAPIFHPVANTFAFSEPMVLLGLLAAPLFWLGASAALATNLVLLVALVTNGLAGYLLARTLELRMSVAVVAGAMVVALPFSHLELGVLTLVPLAPLLLTLHFAIRWSREPSWRLAMAWGSSFAAAYLVCAQLALLGALSMGPAVLWLARREHLTRRVASGLLLAAVTAALLMAPVVTAQLEVRADHELTRTAERTAKGSASPATWARTPWAQLVPTPIVGPAAKTGHRSLFPGTLKVLLACVGLVGWLRLSGRRRIAALLLTFGGLGVWWSSGAWLQLGDAQPFETVRAAVPGLAQIRSFWRAAVFTQLAVVLLACVGLEVVLASARVRSAAGRRAGAAVLALGLVAALEIFPRGQHFTRVPDAGDWQGVTAWLDEHTEPEAALAFVPVPGGKESRHLVQASRWMYLQTVHGRPMVNGYSSFFPKKYRALAKALKTFPSAASHAELRGVGVQHVVALDRWLTRTGREVDPERFEERHHDARAGVRIFEVLRL